MSEEYARFIGNIILKGKIECLTGMHIGGSKDKLEIGGVDSPVIRDPNRNLPYIPASSLKGKMRSALEFSLGKILPNKKGESSGCNCLQPDCPVCRVFGSSAKDRKTGPTRLLIRDAYPDEETIEMWENLDSELMYTEYKSENSIDRLTSAANPRFIERVVKGSKFDVELVYGVYKIDTVDDTLFFKNVIEALKLLEHSALGGSGSRGYGQIAFKFAEPFVVNRVDYVEGTQTFKDSSKPNSDPYFQNRFVKRLSEFDEHYISSVIGKLQKAS
ncbi:MAG: type III-A CRISPR-associated RAMP protein Csm3 [Bacteroidetes bacterium]|nr:type III-A CRISPR-associated RAMP protein Csm3 [Bacteroidota bacterium]